MAAQVLPLPRAKPKPTAVALPQNAFAALPDWARDKAVARLALIEPALERARRGVSVRASAEWLLARAPDDALPSLATLQRWISRALQGDVSELAPAHKGRIRKEGGWEARAGEYARLPSKPYAATIALWLQRDDGFDPRDASESRVRAYLKSLPSNAVEFHPARVGPHFHRQNLKPYKLRDRSELPVGLIYQGDGHSLHYYVQHPNTGRHYTPELTPWMDIASRYIVGWWLGDAESAVQTLYSLSHSLLKHNHVPGILHVDPGSGFKNKSMCDAVSGFVPRLGGVRFMTALPGNAKGKGDIEGWFRWLEERHGKKQSSFKGPTVAQEFLRRLEKRIEKREMVIPVQDEVLAGIDKYVTHYNETNQDNLGKASPAKLWEKLQRFELHISPNVLVRPREVRTARRYGVQIFNRLYRAPSLAAYEQREVQVEYDLHSDATVWLYDMAGRFISEAMRVDAKHWLGESRLADLQREREEGRIKRLERKAEEIRAESRTPITADQTLAGLEHMGAVASLPENEVEGLPPLDLYDTDY